MKIIPFSIGMLLCITSNANQPIIAQKASLDNASVLFNNTDNTNLNK